MLDIRLFGPMHLSHADRSIGRPVRRDVRLILAFLMLNRDREVARHAVASAIWPQADDQLALGRLRRGLHRTLSVLPAQGDEPWVLRPGRAVRWNPNASYRLDLEVFESIYSRVMRPGIGHDPVRVRDDLTLALELMRGPVLEGDETEWITLERERADQAGIQILDRLAQAAEVLGDPGTAVAATTSLLQREPLREDAHRRLMRLYFRQGNTAEAVRQYERCRSALRAEVGVVPQEQTEKLIRSIRSGRLTAESSTDAAARPATGGGEALWPGMPEPYRLPGGAVPEQPVPASDAGTGAEVPAEAGALRRGLPMQPDRFFGRTAELAEGARRLSHDRFVVVTGPPGCGKSRLALAMVADTGWAWGGRVIWVDLSGCSGSAAALRHVAESCAGEGSVDLRAVSRALVGRRTLLVLDNCEHVAEACADLAESLLWSTTELHVLATSRVQFDSPASVTWRVGGLTIGDAGAGSGATFSEAASLFVGRVPRTQLSTAPCDADRAAIEAVCGRLGGLPLAIELAARHVPTLSPGEILLELGDMPRLLDADTPQGMARHGSVCDSVRASCDLLDPDDLECLKRLCAVPELGRTDVERAASPGSRWAALRRLESLVEHSLVEPVATAGTATRYRVLEPVRACVLRTQGTLEKLARD